MIDIENDFLRGTEAVLDVSQLQQEKGRGKQRSCTYSGYYVLTILKNDLERRLLAATKPSLPLERAGEKPPKKLSISEPVTELRHVKIVENGEEMVDFLEACPRLLFARARFNYRRETVVRCSVAEGLCRAVDALPAGCRLAMIEGWRAPIIQQRMYRAIWLRFKERHPDWTDVMLKRVVNRFSAPMDVRVPPPHTTGGAIDVMLTDENGQELDHFSPYEPYDPRCAPFAATGLSDTARRTRDILGEALGIGGLTNYPSEFWHWSFGDQGWAYRGGHPHALYAAITPPGWTPAPEDDVDAPLEFTTPEPETP